MPNYVQRIFKESPAFCILISGFQRRPWGRTMAENSASYPPTVVRSVEEGSDVEQLQEKRKAEFLDTNSTTKRSKPEESLDGGREEIGPNSSKIEQDSERDGHVLGSSERHVDGRRSSDINFMIQAEAAEDRGSRHRMEDAFIVLLDAGMSSAAKLRCAHFAIYDGHGGRLAAEYALKHLHPNVLSAGLLRELLDVKAAKKAILDGFKKTDESLLQESAAGGWQDGATAVCVWILEKTVFVANIGDAKAVVARSSNLDKLLTNSDTPSQLKAIVLTREHKAIYPHERARIQKAGGSVSSNGRLQGRLEVSRAFGDRQFKKVGVIATPDVFSFELTESEQFIILGSDGLWGVFGPSDAVDFVSKLFKEGLSISAVCRRLVKEAVIERGCKDNCTAIVIALGRS